MNYKIILFLIASILLSSCDQNKNNINFTPIYKYKNTGFTLIYNNQLRKEKKISKKIDNRALIIFHKKLKKNSFVKITNPMNQKTVIAKVISNKVKFSEFYNSVITLRVAEELSLDSNEPYIEVVLIAQNTSFIAKKARTFDEEKNVAEKVPVDGIKIDIINDTKIKHKKIIKNSYFKYSIKIADFYYKGSAENMVNRIIKETNIKDPIIKKLSKTKYRVLLGPYNDIKKIEESFENIRLLNFENLEIIKDV